MIDASGLMIFAMIGSVIIWIVMLFRIVLSPFAAVQKLKLFGIMVIIALSYIYVPTWIYNTFNLTGYGVPSLIVCALFLGQIIMYYLIKGNIKQYGRTARR